MGYYGLSHLFLLILLSCPAPNRRYHELTAQKSSACQPLVLGPVITIKVSSILTLAKSEEVHCGSPCARKHELFFFQAYNVIS